MHDILDSLLKNNEEINSCDWTIFIIFRLQLHVGFLVHNLNAFEQHLKAYGIEIVTYYHANSMTTSDSVGIIIIGGGCSGTLVAVQLLRQATDPITIYLVERNNPLFGRGVAYGTQVDSHLLNVTANHMSAFPDDSEHFLRWLQNQPHLIHSLLPQGIHSDTFVPRKLYGTYLQAILDEAAANASLDVRLKRINDEAIAIESHTDGAIVHLQSHQVLHAQKVVLALGNFPPNNPPVQTPEFYNSDRYIRCAWSSDALGRLNSEESILLIGSGLTMVDQVIALQHQGHQGTIHVVSRHGLIPYRHKPEITHDCFYPQTEPQTRAILRKVREEVRSLATHGQDWRTVVDSLRPVTQNLWQTLSLDERRRFLRHVRCYWDVHRHRIAPEIADTVDQLRNSGKLVVYAGRIQSYHEVNGSIDVTIHTRSTKDSIVLRVSRVLNCTGPTSNYEKLQHPLIDNLRQQGLLCPDPLGLGIETALDGALLDTTGAPSKWLYTLGPPRIGNLWETVAVPEIREQAMTLAQDFLSQCLVGLK